MWWGQTGSLQVWLIVLVSCRFITALHPGCWRWLHKTRITKFWFSGINTKTDYIFHNVFHPGCWEWAHTQGTKRITTVFRVCFFFLTNRSKQYFKNLGHVLQLHFVPGCWELLTEKTSKLELVTVHVRLTGHNISIWLLALFLEQELSAWACQIFKRKHCLAISMCKEKSEFSKYYTLQEMDTQWWSVKQVVKV